jgi:replicative DNA helicase
MMAELYQLEPEEPLHSLQMEMATLGSAVLGDREITKAIRAILPDPEKFYRPAHRSIWAACLTLMDASIPCDLEFVTEFILDKQDGTEADIDYLNQVAEYVPSPSLGESYAKQVLDYWTRRQYAELANKARRMSPEQLHIEAEAIRSGSISKTMPVICTLGELPAEEASGVPTGWSAIDGILSCGGWPRGQYTLVRAKTGVGKTPFLTQTAIEVAKKGLKVVYAMFADLSASELQDRCMKYLTGWSHAPTLNLDMAQDWQDKKAFLKKLNIQAYDGSEGHAEVETFCLWLERNPPDFVCIDYLQEIRTQRFMDRMERQAEICSAIKQTAKKLNIPAVMGSQVSNNAQEGDMAKGGRDADDKAALILDIKPDEEILRASKNRFGEKTDIPMVFDKTHLKFNLGGS